LWNRKEKSASACAAKILYVFFIFSTILMCVYLGQGQQKWASKFGLGRKEKKAINKKSNGEVGWAALGW
jgi:hypothetical protein